MCHFITLIAPTNDIEALRTMMARHGRVAAPVDNPSIGAFLYPGEQQFLTTARHCDCGSVLAPGYHSSEALEERLAKETSRLKRKQWSEAKIARAIEDQRKAAPRPRNRNNSPDSLELWAAVLRDLRDDLRLSHAGLFVGFYSGGVETEIFDVSRREIPNTVEWQDVFRSLKEGQVTIIPLH